MFHAKKNILNQMIMFGLLVSVGFATLLYGASPIMAADAPDLGTAGTFGVLADTYTNTVAGTTINGDLGYTTGPAVTPTVNGTTHVADGTYDQAGLDQSSALADLNGQSCISLGTGAVNLDTIDIGSGPGVFTPGCYSSGGAMNITVNQTVTLSGPGVYIFRPGGALTTGADTQIVLDGDICEYDVFWAPAGATTIGANTDFVGNILDPAGITIGANATLEGRALGFGGTVTTDTNLITVNGTYSRAATDTIKTRNALRTSVHSMNLTFTKVTFERGEDDCSESISGHIDGTYNAHITFLHGNLYRERDINTTISCELGNNQGVIIVSGISYSSNVSLGELND